MLKPYLRNADLHRYPGFQWVFCLSRAHLQWLYHPYLSHAQLIWRPSLSIFKEELNRAANAAKHEGLGIDDPEETKERKDEKRKDEQDLSPQAFVTNFLAAGPTGCRKT